MGRSAITRLPEDLVVRGNPYLENFDIELPQSVSDNLQIYVSSLGGDVSISAEDYRQRFRDISCLPPALPSMPM